MDWFNIFGSVFMVIIMIPNIIYAVKCKEGFENKWNNKFVGLMEQIGRIGCVAFMFINIPGTWRGWTSDEAFAIYFLVNVALVIMYCLIWIFCFRKNSMFKAITLSVIPAFIFLFSGIMTMSILLIIAAVLFAPAHILISCKNAAK